MTVARYLQLLIIVTFFAGVIVAQQTQRWHAARAVGRIQAERDDLKEMNSRVLCDIAHLSDSAAIAERLERQHVELVNPVALTKASASENSGPSRNRPSGRR